MVNDSQVCSYSDAIHSSLIPDMLPYLLDSPTSVVNCSQSKQASPMHCVCAAAETAACFNTEVLLPQAFKHQCMPHGNVVTMS